MIYLLIVFLPLCGYTKLIFISSISMQCLVSFFFSFLSSLYLCVFTVDFLMSLVVLWVIPLLLSQLIYFGQRPSCSGDRNRIEPRCVCLSDKRLTVRPNRLTQPINARQRIYSPLGILFHCCTCFRSRDEQKKRIS